MSTDTVNHSTSSVKANAKKRRFSTLTDKELNIKIVDEKTAIFIRIRSGINISNHLEIYEHIMYSIF
jgi:hypothetical protein